MEPSDWIDAASQYQDDVLSIYEHDREGKIQALIQEHGSPYKLAVDLGCGPGKFLPLLCQHFGKVHACDYSQEMLDVACEQTPNHSLTLERCDLRKNPPSCGPADFALCINTLLHPKISPREKMWAQVSNSLQTEGTIVFVLPSLESALLSRHRLVEWNLKSGISATKAHLKSFPKGDPSGKLIARCGSLDAGGTLTKHYLNEEIACTAERFGLTLLSCEKLTYPWTTEFLDPPAWMTAPYPWDWLAVATKPG